MTVFHRPDFSAGNIFSMTDEPTAENVITNSTEAENEIIGIVPDSVGDEHSEINSEGDKENE